MPTNTLESLKIFRGSIFVVFVGSHPPQIYIFNEKQV